jgi:hypothetical protein
MKSDRYIGFAFNASIDWSGKFKILIATTSSRCGHYSQFNQKLSWNQHSSLIALI